MNKPFTPRANDWRIGQIWNKSLESKEERPVEPRDRIWASELGKAPIEVFLKMRGVAPSNLPNPRSKRKFEAGNLFEWFVALILKRAGILKSAQQRSVFTYPGMVQVSGKSDFIAGGVPDYEHYKDGLDALELPESFVRAQEAIMEYLRTTYPEGLGDIYFEVKSCSSFMMNAMEITMRASRNHRLQLFHYLKSDNYPFGLILYICRDDLRIIEIPVGNPSETEDEYRRAIETISGYYQAHKDTPIDSFLLKPDTADEIKWQYNFAGIEGLPPLEKDIVFDEDLGKFSRNWNVEYSSYLSMLYGYADQMAFEEVVMPQVGRWNRIMARLKVGQKRAIWLAENGLNEGDVQDELVVVPGRKNRVRVQFVQVGAEKRLVPADLAKGYKLTPDNVEVMKEIVAAGYDPMALTEKFVDVAEEEEETA